MSTRNPIKCSTTYYEFAHGSKPRGRGSWAFFYHRGASSSERPHFCPFSCTFTEARAWAKREARAAGCDKISVAS